MDLLAHGGRADGVLLGDGADIAVVVVPGQDPASSIGATLLGRGRGGGPRPRFPRSIAQAWRREQKHSHAHGRCRVLALEANATPGPVAADQRHIRSVGTAREVTLRRRAVACSLVERAAN
jgi:hypothetical protein